MPTNWTRGALDPTTNWTLIGQSLQHALTNWTLPCWHCYQLTQKRDCHVWRFGVCGNMPKWRLQGRMPRSLRLACLTMAVCSNMKAVAIGCELQYVKVKISLSGVVPKSLRLPSVMIGCSCCCCCCCHCRQPPKLKSWLWGIRPQFVTDRAFPLFAPSVIVVISVGRCAWALCRHCWWLIGESLTTNWRKSDD